jgi:hypothetical protein
MQKSTNQGKLSVCYIVKKCDARRSDSANANVFVVWTERLWEEKKEERRD